MNKIGIILSLSLLMTTASSAQPAGPYFGQQPPGKIPKIFSPNFISTNAYEVAGSFSPDGLEFTFTRRPDYEGSANRLFITVIKNGKWTKPVMVPFGQDVMEFESHISQTGDRLFYNSDRIKPSGKTGRGDIWFCERENNSWGEPQYLNGPVSEGFTMYVTSTLKGDLYFTGGYNRQYGIYRSVRSKEGYGQPEYLPMEINDLRPSHPYIAPDESYIIFDAYTAKPRNPELYISFRKVDGSWTKAAKLGPDINANQTEYAASVSPDGKYLFFHRLTDGNGDIWWVDAGVLEEYRIKMPSSN